MMLHSSHVGQALFCIEKTKRIYIYGNKSLLNKVELKNLCDPFEKYLQ